MSRQGPPKHQNKYAWNPNSGIKINETEVGGRFQPLSDITGVCPRCREQIDWKRRYGKYKPIVEPAKWNESKMREKRAVRQAHHKLYSGCAKENGICAKCCCKTGTTVGRDIEEVEAEKKALDEMSLDQLLLIQHAQDGAVHCHKHTHNIARGFQNL